MCRVNGTCRSQRLFVFSTSAESTGGTLSTTRLPAVDGFVEHRRQSQNLVYWY